MALGVFACTLGVYLHIAIGYHERAYAVLALGAVVFLMGVVGRHSDAHVPLILRLSHPLRYEVLALGLLTTLALIVVPSSVSNRAIYSSLRKDPIIYEQTNPLLWRDCRGSPRPGGSRLLSDSRDLSPTYLDAPAGFASNACGGLFPPGRHLHPGGTGEPPVGTQQVGG